MEYWGDVVVGHTSRYARNWCARVDVDGFCGVVVVLGRAECGKGLQWCLWGWNRGMPLPNLSQAPCKPGCWASSLDDSGLLLVLGRSAPH